MAGKFIVLEGMDGAGTTTQSRLLVENLSERGFKVTASAEPTKSTIGQETRRLLGTPILHNADLLTSLALCFAADRMQHVHDVIRPALLSGDFVVLDRYVLSSLVYQGLHLPTSFVKEINRYAVKPDLVIVLDLDAKRAHERLNHRVTAKEFYEAPAILAKIRDRYLQCAGDDVAHTVVLNADASVEHVHDEILRVIETRFLR